jgi:F420-non-reducing hydrogenase large subunit
MKKISVDPITRLEGHGKIEIFVKDDGEVANVYFQIPELRGFERFCVGRPVEELARITPRICGVCPEAHHMAATKAIDGVFGVQPTPTARKLRELLYNGFFAGDHTTHFFVLAGPDFVVGPMADPAERNILGVIAKVGLETGGAVIKMRADSNELVSIIGGKAIHPVAGLPGGVSKPVTKEEQERLKQITAGQVEFAKVALQIFNDIVLANNDYIELIKSDAFTHETYYMGLMDDDNRINFYDGKVRVVGPDGKEFVKFSGDEYLDVLAEHVEPYSYLVYPYLKKIGWKGFVDGSDSGVYRASPLSRCNAADGMATPLAQAEYERMYATLGGKPVHATLATHWARLVELMFAAERANELANDPDLTNPDVRAIPTGIVGEGVGVVEAPRGTLYHHYKTDDQGIVTAVNLIVGTTNNNAAISMSLKKAAEGLIKKDAEISEGLLNMVEMAFRAYDPCFGCATHTLPGEMPLEVAVRSQATGEVLNTVKRLM